MAKAQKLPSGTWRIRVYDKIQKKQVSFTAETKKECEIWAALYKPKTRANITTGEAIDEYIELKSNILSPTTIMNYKKIRKNTLADLCPIKIDDLTQTMIQKHINTLAVSKSPKYIKNSYGLLTATLKMFRPDFHPNITLPKKQKKFKEYPTPGEVFAAVRGSAVELPCLMALWLGMRMSEIRGAKKTDIKDGVLTISSVMVTVDGKSIEKKATKTYDSARKLRIPPYIADLIERLPEEQIYLVPKSSASIYEALKNRLAAAKLPLISFHDLRHLNASAMLALGIPDKYAMERGGWSSPELMRNTYQHTFSAEREAVDQIVDKFFEQFTK